MRAEQGKFLALKEVCVSRVGIDGIDKMGVTNSGMKQTIGNQVRPGVETHVLDFSGDLYGKILEVRLYHYQRAECRFGSIEELKTQMHKDMDQARKFLVSIVRE